MGTRSGIPVFVNQDMTISDSFVYPTTTRYSIFIQIYWIGLSGVGKFKIQGSIKGSTWSDYPLQDCDSCVYEREMIGAEDNYSVLIDNWMPDKIRIVYTSNTATAGTLNAEMTLIDNQDSSR